MKTSLPSMRSWLGHWLPCVLLACVSAGAWAQLDPPARVASLSHIEGTVALAPAGETEWADATVNRPITRGDRLWTDPGARAEVHLGSATLHLDSQTFVELVALDDEGLQLNLNEGAVNARVRQLAGGDNFEITTPQLAFRAAQPGDYRIDVDPARGITRVTVRSGVALLHGSGGGTLQLARGQQLAFAGRDLAPAYGQTAPLQDRFDRWAADRNRAEDQSISARYVPREVVGYHQLDANGVWSNDPNYGAVWYPRLLATDWAPYRYGRWEWIVPWGWTWIDDAPWGFAPSHYGRWAQIGSRWAWVPGRMGTRPVYSPALVGFVGDGFSSGAGASIGWFPLAPGEAWRPTYRASSLYLRNVNPNIFAPRSGDGFFFHRYRPDAITTVRTDDFNRGRPVHQHWRRVNPADLSRAPILAQPMLPEPRRWSDSGFGGRAQAGIIQPVMPAIVARPQPQLQPPGDAIRPDGRMAPEDRRWQQRARPDRIQQPPPAPIQQQSQQWRQDRQERQLHLHGSAAQPPREPRPSGEHSVRAHQGAPEQQLRRQDRAARQQPNPAPSVQPPVPQARAQSRGRVPERESRGPQRADRSVQSNDGSRGKGRGEQRSLN